MVCVCINLQLCLSQQQCNGFNYHEGSAACELFTYSMMKSFGSDASGWSLYIPGLAIVFSYLAMYRMSVLNPKSVEQNSVLLEASYNRLLQNT